MNGKFTSNNTEDYEFTLNSEENDYKYLITRLKEISKSISLLKKTILK